MRDRVTGMRWHRLGFAGLVLMTALGGSHASAAIVLSPASGSPFAVGLRPTGVAIGDFNGDGKQDIAVCNSGSQSVTVFLGNGVGGFAAAPGSPFQAGLTPMGIIVKDFNKDGKMDLAVANQNSNNVTVLLGDGAGGFAAAPGSPFAVGATPQFLATGDFNGDTIPDLAVSNASSNTVTVLLGNGSGGFTPSAGSPFAVGLGPEGIVTADFDSDGKTDIAVADGTDGNVTYLYGNGTGGFSLITHAQGCNPNAASFCGLVGMIGGNFYNHPYTDLVTIASGIGELNILRGSSNGTVTYNNQFSAPGILNAATADFDSDGNQDIAVVSTAISGIVIVMSGNGNGSFNAQTAPYFQVGKGPYGVATADFNGDNKPDLVVTNSTDNTITVLLSPAPVVPLAPPAPVITQVPQTITFAVANHLGSDQPFALVATASSGLPVTFKVMSGAATVSGNTLTLTGIGTVTVEAAQAGSSAFSPATSDQSFNVALGAPAITSVVNGASFTPGLAVPTNYYATIFGNNLVSETAHGDATSSQILSGTTVTIVDSAKSTFTADLWYASYGQINFVVPAAPAAGAATVTVTNGTGKAASFQVMIGAIAPGLFSVDGSGTGMALADVVIVQRDLVQIIQPTAVETPFGPIGVPIPLAAGTQVYLNLSGTGIRGLSSLKGVVLTVGGITVPVSYAGAQGGYPALDQIDALLPVSFAGTGTAKVQVTVDGVASNTLTVLFR